MIRKFPRHVILLGVLAWQTGGGVLFAQEPPDQKADELIRSAQQSEILGYVLAGIGVLLVAAVLPIAIILGRKKRAGQDDDELNLRGERERPYWVKLALWGLPNRASAWIFFWLAIAIAVACSALGFVEPVFFVGSMMVGAALWYYAAIKWVDEHGRW